MAEKKPIGRPHEEEKVLKLLEKIARKRAVLGQIDASQPAAERVSKDADRK